MCKSIHVHVDLDLQTRIRIFSTSLDSSPYRPVRSSVMMGIYFVSSAYFRGKRQSSGDEFEHACHSAMHYLLFRWRCSSGNLRQIHMCVARSSQTRPLAWVLGALPFKNREIFVCVVSFQLQCRAVQTMGRKTQNEKFNLVYTNLSGRVVSCWRGYCIAGRYTITSLMCSMVVFGFGGQVKNDPALVVGSGIYRTRL